MLKTAEPRLEAIGQKGSKKAETFGPQGFAFGNRIGGYLAKRDAKMAESP